MKHPTTRHDADPTPRRERRSDRGLMDLLPPVLTQEGFLLVEGRFAKGGILEYRTATGVVRELIEFDELSRADSIATLAFKPVTLEHPTENVTPATVSTVGVGAVGSEVKVVEEAEGGFVSVKFVVHRKDALNAINSGISELSPGYEVDVIPTPGDHPVYGHYDAIQRNRRYNHLAITERARGGPEIRMRTDSLEPRMDPKLKLALVEKLVQYGVSRADAETMPEDKIDAIVKAYDSMAGKLDAMQKQLDAACAKVDMFEKTKKADSDKAAAEATAKAQADAEAAFLDRFNARHKLVSLASQYKVDSVEKLSDADLRKAIVFAAAPTSRKDGSDAYYDAAIEFLGVQIEAGTVRTDSHFGTPTAGDTKPAAKDEPEESGEAAFLKNLNTRFDAARGIAKA